MQNIIAVNMTKEKFEGVFDCTCACFFVVERIADEDFIKNIAKRIIGDGCRSFTFFGKHRCLWENIFDDIDIEINPKWEDEDHISLTKTDKHIELFAAGIIGEFKPTGYIFYDDEAVYKEVLMLAEKDDEDETKRYILNDNCIRDMFFKICKF